MDNKYGTDQLIDDIFSIIPIFNKKIFKASDELLRSKQEVSGAHIKLMFVLRKKRITTMTELGRILSISKPSVTALIERLVDLNFCKRNPDSTDRRIILVELTEQGHAFLNQHINDLKEVFKRSLTDFTDQDIETFKDTLSNMRNLLEKFKEEA